MTGKEVFGDHSQQRTGSLGIGDQRAEPAAYTIVVSNDFGTVVTINPDGSIKRGSAFTTNDAASLDFWTALERMTPQFFPRGHADLLAACKDCLENRGDWMAAMSAAIAKAEGRS